MKKEHNKKKSNHMETLLNKLSLCALEIGGTPTKKEYDNWEGLRNGGLSKKHIKAVDEIVKILTSDKYNFKPYEFKYMLKRLMEFDAVQQEENTAYYFQQALEYAIINEKIEIKNNIKNQRRRKND